MTISAGPRPLRTWADSLLRIPRVTGRLAAVPSALIAITNLLTPSGSVWTASAGMTNALLAERPVIVVWTGVAAFSVPFAFATRSQTSTVVLPGSSAGLISETLAVTGSVTPGTVMVAGAP